MTMNKQKTFDELLIMQCYGAEDTFTCKEIKKTVKEWLTQYHNEIMINKPLTNREEQKDCDNMILLSRLMMDLKKCPKNL